MFSLSGREKLRSAEIKRPQFFYGYAVVVAAFFILVVMWGTAYSFGIFFKPLLTEFGWTRATTSGAFSLFSLLYGFLAIVSGRLNDKFGPRIVVTACGFFMGLGYLLMSQINTIWQLYFFYGVLIPMGMSGGLVPLVSTVTRWFVKRRGMMTGIVVAGVGVGTIIMPPVASWLISSYGWRASYIIVGIVALILIILAAQFLRRDPSQVGQVPYGGDVLPEKGLDLQDQGFTLQEAIRTRQLWMFFAILFCYGICLNAIMVHIAPHATDLKISEASAASILAVIGGLGMVGKITMGGAVDRLGGKLALIISLILMSGALLWLLAAKDLWMLYLFAVIFGFGYGGMVVVQSPIVAELFGLSSHGVIFGVLNAGYTTGGAIGPVLAGHTFDILDSYQVAFLVCAVLAVIAIILAWLLRPTAYKG